MVIVYPAFCFPKGNDIMSVPALQPEESDELSTLLSFEDESSSKSSMLH